MNIAITTHSTYARLVVVSGVLFVGTIFAWYTVYADFQRFFSLGGDIFSLVPAGPLPHPAMTPCFWGAFAFLAALIWALRQLWARSTSSQRHLVYFLLGGGAFAWSNVGLQFYDFYTAVPGEQVSCSGVAITNPFTTACFIGATLFLASLCAALWALRALARQHDRSC